MTAWTAAASTGLANERMRIRSVAIASPGHSGWTSRSWRPVVSMDNVFALSQGPPTHVSRSVEGSTFATTSWYASTDAPSPGVPDVADRSQPLASVTSMVTSSFVAWVRTTWTGAVDAALGAGLEAVVDGITTGLGDGWLSGSDRSSFRGSWPTTQAATRPVIRTSATGAMDRWKDW